MKVRFWFLGTIAFWIFSVLFLLTAGTKSISFWSICTSLLPFTQNTLSPVDQIILAELRAPRIFLALIIGSALAVSGTCQQAIFRNPLAEPFVLGLSGGASLGAALAICLKFPQYVSIAAFIGGVSTILLVDKLGSYFGDSNKTITHLLLAGMAISAFASALLSALMAIFSQEMQIIFFWIMGSVAQPPENWIFLSLLILAGMLGMIYFSKEMDLMSLGEEQAFYLGIPVQRLRKILLLVSAFVVSLSVSMSGPIGFIGLVTPHLLRNWFTPIHRYLLPLAALWGGILLLWADGLIRLFPLFSTLPIGAITALFGSPFFLYILIRKGLKS